MIEELTHLINNFPSPANQTQCFLHVLNLIVKSIIQQFDVSKSKKTLDSDDEDDINEATKELLKLTGDMELEEEITAGTGDNMDETDDDNVTGWVDEHEEMTKEELMELWESVQLVRLLLTKVKL